MVDGVREYLSDCGYGGCDVVFYRSRDSFSPIKGRLCLTGISGTRCDPKGGATGPPLAGGVAWPADNVKLSNEIDEMRDDGAGETVGAGTGST